MHEVKGPDTIVLPTDQVMAVSFIPLIDFIYPNKFNMVERKVFFVLSAGRSASKVGASVKRKSSYP